MKRIIVCLSIGLVTLASCTQIKSKTKETIKEVGEGVGTGVSELGKGLKDGVENSFQIEIEKNENLSDSGIELGKTLQNDSSLDIYTIYNKDFNDSLLVKVFDKTGQEIGRQKTLFSGKKDAAHYINIEFDSRTNIDYDSKVTIEKM